MADSKLSALTENTAPEARDELYIVDLSEDDEADRSKKVTMESLFDSVVILDGAIVTLDDQIVTL